jgi:mannitol 2-dehydrogenase
VNRLNLKNLPPNVLGPDYPRSEVIPGIAHIGVGAFHRAHLAVYIEACLSNDDQSGWGLLGINLLERDAELAKALQDQGILYSVTEFAPDGTSVTRLIGAMVEHAYAPDNPAALLVRLADPSIRIVSLTITEGGYLLNGDGNFRFDDEGVVHDLANPELPRTAFSLIVGALNLRRAAGVPPFTVMSRDNLRHNGDQARRAFVAYAKAHSLELAAWIEGQVDFPNSMVDRITPAMTAGRQDQVNAASGLDDLVPVVCEDFIQWVVEDHFCYGRPAWERHGTQMVADVTPYEEAKIRLLNGAHQMLSYPAFLAGYRRVDMAMAHPLFHNYLQNFLECDAGVWLHSLPGMELSSYGLKLLQRFANPAIAYQLARLCLDGGSKIPGFLEPTLSACLHAGRDARRLAFLLACFDRYVRAGHDDLLQVYPLCEPSVMQRIQPMIDNDSPMTLLESVELVGIEALQDTRFVAQYLTFVDHLSRHGVRETLDNLDLVASDAVLREALI